MRNPARFILVALLIVAAALRVWNYPRVTEVRDVDELTYLEGGLDVLEGLMPGNKAAPGAPLVWFAWSYTSVKSALYFLSPGPQERAVPGQIRPFFALDHAQFDVYRDISGLRNFVLIIHFLLALVAVWAAWRIGFFHAGIAGGLLSGSLFALLPLVVDFSNQTRPYIEAWSFGLLAMYFAVAWSNDKRRWQLAAVFLGLAISARIDMLALTPLILWALWYRRTDGTTWAQLVRSFIATVVLAGLVAQLVAPWLILGILHNLRVIATTAFAPPPGAVLGWRHMLVLAGWENGLFPALGLFVAGIIFLGREKRWLALLGTLYVLLMLTSILKDNGYGIRHKSGAVMALVLMSGVALAPIVRRWPRAAVAFIAISALLPLVQTLRMTHVYRSQYARDDSIDWLEKNVAGGTRVYIMDQPLMTKRPLPTTQAADRIWGSITAPHAYEKKFDAGLRRFGIASPQYPRAFSEEIMLTERMYFRPWWVLSGHQSLPTPRYDIALPRGVFTVGVEDVPTEFHRSGGVVILKGQPNAAFGAPRISFASPGGFGTHVYVRE